MADGEKLFNLIDEPWILVRKNSGETTEVSLLDALTHAHEYDALAGELPTQDVAILRLMLAVLYTVFTRYNADGSEREYVPDFDDMVDMWKEVWDSGYLPEQPIREYLDKCHERFWLFHPERPFYQANSAKNGSEYTSAKLNGEVAEGGSWEKNTKGQYKDKKSEYKPRIFSKYNGQEKDQLSFSQAARWLLHLNGFDDTALKRKEKIYSNSLGWIGTLGLIWTVGENLFKTMMLNFVFTNDAPAEWYENHPIWESVIPREAELVKIVQPNNPAEFYTTQSRRVFLIREENKVTNFAVLGGDFFNENNVFIEQMTVWEYVAEKTQEYYIPKCHDATKQVWREFSSITANKDKKRRPGVIQWLSFLKENKLISDDTNCYFGIASFMYGEPPAHKQFDYINDSLIFNINILSEKGNCCRNDIEEEIMLCDKIADDVSKLMENLSKASGLSGNDKNSKRIIDFKTAQAKEQYYARIDGELRRWIASVNPSQSEKERYNKRLAWRNRNKQIALALGRELINKMSSDAFVGREIEEKKGSKKIKYHYSIPEAEIRFIHNIKHIDD